MRPAMALVYLKATIASSDALIGGLFATFIILIL
jgi:hypothetical protein